MIDLEDNVSDIVSKAQRGLEISDSELAKRSGVSVEAIRQTRAGDFEEESLRAIAPALSLDADALVDLAKNNWRPTTLENFDGLAQFNTSYGGMLVNAYLVWDLTSKEAVV